MANDNLIVRAAQFAATEHYGQLRKYSEAPYIEHPLRVAGHATLLNDATPEIIAAAWLHDVVEDCGVLVTDLHRKFGSEVADLVAELTNPSKRHPELSRKDRKKMDREHIVAGSRWAKALKLIDRFDNLCDMALAIRLGRLTDKEFVGLYCHESKQLAEGITHIYLNQEISGLGSKVREMAETLQGA